MSTIQLTCPVCEQEFHKPKNEYNRRTKLGRPIYCSRNCSGKANFGNIPEEKRYSDASHLAPGNKADEYSPFRWHLNRCHQRKSKDCNLDLVYLKELWENQKGRCPFTGWKLKQMPNTNHVHQLPKTPDRASLDRIDSSKGYVKGNVQFVSYMAQCCKGEFSAEQVREFCESVLRN